MIILPCQQGQITINCILVCFSLQTCLSLLGAVPTRRACPPAWTRATGPPRTLPDSQNSSRVRQHGGREQTWEVVCIAFYYLFI